MKETLRTLREAIDEQRPVLLPLRDSPRPASGWIMTIRSALGMSQKVLADRMKVAKQRVSQIEAREVAGETTLAQMQDAADALGCEFVYVLIPKVPLEETVTRRASAIARRELAAVERTMQLEDQETPITDKRVQDYVTRYVTERDLWADDR